MTSRSAAAQRRAQRQVAADAAAQQRAHVAHVRAQRRASYGPYRVADVRTWFGWQWFCGLTALTVVAALPAILGDGPIAQIVWLIAVALGLVAGESGSPNATPARRQHGKPRPRTRRWPSKG